MTQLVYDQFLVFLTRELRIFYMTIEESNEDVQKNSILEKYTDCTIKREYFVCSKGGDFYDIIKIDFQEKKLNFETLKTVELKNTVIKNIILSEGNSGRIIYTSKNKKQYLQFYENGVNDHYEVSLNFENTVVHQFEADTFLLISTSEENYLIIRYLINNSILSFPSEITRSI